MARASGDYAGGRAMLARTRQTLRASPAADQAMCQKLMADLRDLGRLHHLRELVQDLIDVGLRMRDPA